MANVFSNLGCAMAGMNVETHPTSKIVQSPAKLVTLIAVQTVPSAMTLFTDDVMGFSTVPEERMNKRVVS
jgi:hypothetical protein